MLNFAWEIVCHCGEKIWQSAYGSRRLLLKVGQTIYKVLINRTSLREDCFRTPQAPIEIDISQNLTIDMSAPNAMKLMKIGISHTKLYEIGANMAK